MKLIKTFKLSVLLAWLMTAKMLLATKSSKTMSVDYQFWKPEIERRQPIAEQSGFGWSVDECLRQRDITRCSRNNDILTILNRFNISYLANYFGKTEEQIIRIKMCF